MALLGRVFPCRQSNSVIFLAGRQPRLRAGSINASVSWAPSQTRAMTPQIHCNCIFHPLHYFRLATAWIIHSCDVSTSKHICICVDIYIYLFIYCGLVFYFALAIVNMSATPSKWVASDLNEMINERFPIYPIFLFLFAGRHCSGGKATHSCRVQWCTGSSKPLRITLAQRAAGASALYAPFPSEMEWTTKGHKSSPFPFPSL